MHCSEHIYEEIRNEEASSAKKPEVVVAAVVKQAPPDAKRMASKSPPPRRGLYDEELDFTPQNGYVEEDMDDEDVDENGERKSRDRRKKPLGQRLKNMRMPSPGTIATGYLNSEFHHSNFKQPLVSRARVEDQEVQQARKLLVERNTPAELAKVSSPFDIPLPKFKKNRSKSRGADEKKEDGESKFGYGTLPKSWKEQNLVTGVKENDDPELLKARQNAR